MHLTWLVAGALIPREFADAVTSSIALPNLTARVSRARRTDAAQASSSNYSAHLDWIARHLFDRTAPAPTAPYAYAYLSGSKSAQTIWHADLVHIEVARDSLIVQSLDQAPPTTAEAQQLFEVANGLASHLGVEFTPVNDHWFLRSDRQWAIEADALEQVLDAPLTLPTGADASVWNRLHNEIQMAWHTHAANETREVNAEPTINGIWLHGGGRWKPLPPIPFRDAASDAAGLRGAAEAAGARAVSTTTAPTDRSLSVFDDALAARRRHDWTAWARAVTALDRRLAAHVDDSIDLILSATTVRTFQLTTSDRFRFWRRQSLAEALGE